jgi:two-component system, OmpR family, sensor histidine kinase KdpD
LEGLAATVREWLKYTLATAAVALVAVAFGLFGVAPEAWVVTALFLFTVVLVASTWGRAPAVAAAFASAILLNLLIVPPPNAFSIPTAEEFARLLTLLAAAITVGTWKNRALRVEREARELVAREKLQNSLLDSISHDLKTPLTAIIGALDVLLVDEPRLSEGDRRELLEVAYDRARRLDRLVGAVLEMTRMGARPIALRREPVQVADVIQYAMAHLQERSAEGRCRTAIAAGLPSVLIDATLISQALVNILDNAARYSAPDAPINVEAGARNGHVLISVADRGVGVPPSELEHIFEKFYRRVSPSAPPSDDGGIGLGLAIAKGIVEAHGGQIWAEQRTGGGTVIKIMLLASDR